MASDSTASDDTSYYEPTDIDDDFRVRVPGPLTTAALAIFGNSSMFSVASSASLNGTPPALAQMCQRRDIPFSRIGYIEQGGSPPSCGNVLYQLASGDTPYDWTQSLNYFLQDWLTIFLDPATAQ